MILSYKNVILFCGDNMELNSWLSEKDGKKELFSLNIPATHDSSTNFVQFSYIAKCQNLSIYEQLNLGIRALDIRVQIKKGRLKMVHSIAKVFTDSKHFRQMDLSDVLEQCYAFLEKNSTETIIFMFKNDNSKNFEKSFDILYNTYIKENKSKWFLENRSPLLKEARGKIVLLRRCKRFDRKEYTDINTGIDFSHWTEQTEKEPFPLPLETGGKHKMTFLIQDRFKYAPKQRWSEVIKPFLDGAEAFDGIYLINYLSTAGGIKGPKGNAKYINSKFSKYALSDKCFYGLIFMDFPEKSIVRKIINSNQ